MVGRGLAVLVALAVLVSPGMSLDVCAPMAKAANDRHACCCDPSAAQCPMNSSTGDFGHRASNGHIASNGCGCAMGSREPVPVTPAAPIADNAAPGPSGILVADIAGPAPSFGQVGTTVPALPEPVESRYLSLCSFRC